MKKLSMVLLLLVITQMYQVPTKSCSAPPPPPPTEAKEHARAVYYGEVVSVNKQWFNRTLGSVYDLLSKLSSHYTYEARKREPIITVRVMKAWKGPCVETLQLVSEQSLPVGQRYVFYLREYHEFWADIGCGSRLVGGSGVEEECAALGEPLCCYE
jgi:hypothetical protein